MSHYLNKTAVYLLFGFTVFIGATVLTVLIDKPTAYGQGCGPPDCIPPQPYQVYNVPYPDTVCRTDMVPITHYYNTTRPVKQYYSYQVPGPCRTETGWTCGKRNRWGACTKKDYYRRTVCEPARTVSGWRWVDEPITASYITLEPKQVCETKTLYRTETYWRPKVCTPKVCPPPSPPAPTCQNDLGCTPTTKGSWQCIAGTDNQYKVCQQVGECYKWTERTFTCGGNTTCFSPVGSVVPGQCKTRPGSGIPGVLVSDKCFTLQVGNGPAPIARTGNFNLTVGERAEFSLRWDLNDYPGCSMISNPLVNCEKWGTQLSGPGGNWQGSANKVAGNIGPFSFSGQSNQKPHNFQIACNGAPASNLVVVTYERGNTPLPPPPSCIPCSNPGAASKSCINGSQWQECVTQNGKNCLATFSCSQFAGTTCSNPGGYCVGKPVGPNPEGGCTSNANCPSGTTCDIPSGRCVVAETHAVCQNGSCVSASGPGANQCQGNLDCSSGPPPQQPPPCVGAICDQTPPDQNPLPLPICRPGIDSQCTPPGGVDPGTPPTCTIGVDCPSGCTVGVNCPGGVLPPGGGGAGGPVPGKTQCSDGDDNDNDGKIDNGVKKEGKYYPPDSGCADSNNKYDWTRNSEFNFRIKEIIPDFFNLNWFKINVANFFKAEALAK